MHGRHDNFLAALSVIERRDWQGALEGGSVPEAPAFCQWQLFGYDLLWLLAEADYFGTSPEDIVEGCLQHARFLFVSGRITTTGSLERDLSEMSMQSAALRKRCVRAHEQLWDVAGIVRDEAARLEIRCPQLDIQPSLALEHEEVNFSTVDDVGAGHEFVKFLAAKHNRAQFLAPDLVHFVLKKAEEYEIQPEQMLQCAIRLARFVMKNSGGLGISDFKRELFVRQTELDRTILQIDRLLQSLESVLPRMKFLVETAARSSETILRRAGYG